MPNDAVDGDSPSVRQPRHYRDFNVRFGSFNANTFKVWVEGPALGGSIRPDQAVQRLYDPKLFWDDPDRGVGGPLGELERRSLRREDLLKLGSLLADMALPDGEVRTLFQKSVDLVARAGEVLFGVGSERVFAS
jgi:hypothetical protein